MGQIPGWHRDKQGARHRLLDSLAGFAQSNRARITVVFDGAPEPNFPDGSQYQGVLIYYAAAGSTADERIKRIVEQSRDRRGLIVVTSDKELFGYARACGARAMRSGEFRKLLSQGPEKIEEKAAVEEFTGDARSWMRYFGVDAEEEGDEP